MFWQISRLVILIWRNRLRQLFRRMPALWLVVLLAVISYCGGAYLGYGFFYKITQLTASSGSTFPQLRTIIVTAFFSTFGLTAFILVSFALLFTPEETTLKRILAPLPISPMQQRPGLLLPGIILLFLAQNLLWLPALLAFIQAGLATPLQLLLAVFFGLLAYNAITLAFHQAALYGITRLFGAERVDLRSAALGLSIALGMVLFTLPLILGAQALLARQPGWLILTPAYWMALILQPDLLRAVAGLGLLSAIGLLGGGIYAFCVERCERLAVGTRGQWVPLRQLSFPSSLFMSSCLYELKGIARDQQLVVGLMMVVAGWLVATVAVFWTRASNPLLSYALLELALDLTTVLLCAIAQMSWGRDSHAYRVLASTPLEVHRLLDGKLFANLVVIAGGWVLLVGVLTWAGNNPLLLPQRLPLLCIGCFLCFALGIAVPYSTEDPLSMLTATGVMVILGLPLYMLFQLAQEALARLPGGMAAQMLVQTAAALLIMGMLYLGIHQLADVKMEKDRD
uniref:Uncharacterized protein n=1 Tax=Thermogemmatispora argillosa TaxID=2045280 RepID=A0A455SX49_9CHLR|nr:hypothetical protein KTA_11460 [Thermogemmatispora argillosa]